MRALARLLPALLSLMSTPALATIVSSAVTGRVTTNNAPAVGVTVTITSTSLMHPRSTSTGPRGTFWIEAIPPGQYDVTFSRAGLTTLTRRAIVELGRVARADAALEASEEEETVTSTATTISVADTTEITTHWSDAALDRMPVHRDPRSAADLGPVGVGTPSSAMIDNGFVAIPQLVGEELIQEVTVIRAGAPVEYNQFGGSVISAITRSGGEAFFVSLRDTISSNAWLSGSQSAGGIFHLYESASGGRLVPDRLWFFAAGWKGDQARALLQEVRGYEIKLTAEPTAKHHLLAEVLEGMEDDHGPSFGARSSLLHYSTTSNDRFTFAATVNRGEFIDDQTLAANILTARASYRLSNTVADHLLTIGGTKFDHDFTELTSLHVSDRWSSSKWTLVAGLRYDDSRFGSELTPRTAFTYDLRGDGRRAFVVTYGEYVESTLGAEEMKVATVGYAAAIGSSGTARVDVIRRQFERVLVTELQGDVRYRLFDRFEAGLNFSYIDNDVAPEADEIASGWISAEIPLGAHELGATVLQRYIDTTDLFLGSYEVWPLDIGLRYGIPLSRVRLTVAADLANAFDSGEAQPRSFRVWIRARV